MFANAGHNNGHDQARMGTLGSPPEAADDTDSELGEMLPEPVINVDPVKRRSPMLPALAHNNPFDIDSPVLQPVNGNDNNSIDDLSFEEVSDYGKSEPILSTPSLTSSLDETESAADLDDFAINTPNLVAVGQAQAAAILDKTAPHQYEFINAGVGLTTRGMFVDPQNDSR